MSADTDRAARLYVNGQLVAAAVGVLLIVVLLIAAVVQSATNVVRTNTPAPTTVARTDCWDYGQPFPPGWVQGMPPLPSCHTDH
jgi:hypothetical protein